MNSIAKGMNVRPTTSPNNNSAFFAVVQSNVVELTPPKPRKYPKQTRSKILVDSIKQTTEMLLKTTPMAELKSTKIAEITGICMGSLYQYYPNTEAIVTTLYEDAILATSASLQNKSAPLSSAKQQLNELHTLLSAMDEQYQCTYYQDFYSKRLSVNYVNNFTL
jgi:AcrR family transcriptional regulator